MEQIIFNFQNTHLNSIFDLSTMTFATKVIYCKIYIYIMVTKELQDEKKH